MKTKKILIIGGCGYIGSHLFDILKNDYEVETVDFERSGNFSNPKNIKIDFSKLTQKFLNKFDTIIFLAGNSSVPQCEDVIDTFDKNVIQFFNLIRKLKNKKFIYASSSCVYIHSSKELKEESNSLKPNDGLTLSKTVIDYLMELSDVEFYGLRFGSVNGWSKNTRLDLMINSMTFSAIKNKKISVFNGEAHRPIVSINDLGRAVKKIIETTEDKRGVYNIASFNTSIINAAETIAKKLHCDLINPDLSLSRKGGNYDFCVSSEKFCKSFNFKFEDTIETIVDSLLSNEFNDKWTRR